MTLIHELIEIPTTQAAEDFVLRLTEGVANAEATLRDYVVTGNLAPKFDEALSLIQSALGVEVTGSTPRVVKAPQSRAAYLHGSFGSGKSHFMAVLYLLLQRHPDAVGITELAEQVRKHMPWIEGRKFLLLPFHMLNAQSIEEKVLGGYLSHMRRQHPEAPTPALLVAEDLFRDAERQRKAMSDEVFLKELNARSDPRWGGYATTWTIERYAAAQRAAHDDTEHDALVTTLLDTIATPFRDVASHSGGRFVKLDRGLEIMTEHAKALGYDAVIFLLDELILWLASHAADQAFLEREIDKLVNLVEAHASRRPIPIVSFVARQRDLRELVSENMPGVQQLGYVDKLRYHEGRFGKITLEDRDLPTIASKRLLSAKTPQAKAQIDEQFQRSTRIAQDTLAILMTRERTIQDFRKVYPFSPALVEVLVDASSMLQRDRTALKAMRQLLVQRRGNLELGEFIPLGDLFDVIATGNDAIVDSFKVSFDRARKLWREKLQPLLEQEHDVQFDELAARPWNDPLRTKVRNDERVLKTLLLATLVSNVPSLKGLNAKRVAALNHGTIKAPFPGQEAQAVLAKIKKWATVVPEIRMQGAVSDPTLSIELTGVDIEGILVNAAEQESPAARVTVLRRLVFQDLGVDPDASSLYDYSFDWTWRGTQRSASLVFQDVAQLRAVSLDYSGEAWKVVLDLPIDPDGQGTHGDRARIEEFRQSGKSAHTLVWSPQVFNQQTLRDLIRLVRIDIALRGDNFRRCASHIPETDHATARNMLEGNKLTLENRLRTVLLAAYGVATQGKDGLDAAIQIDEPFLSLDSSFTPQPPVGGTLKVALEGLLDQAMAHRYALHPKFEEEVGRAALKRVGALCRLAVTKTANRVEVEPPRRKETLGIVVPLQLGEMTGLDRPFVLGQTWKQHFQQRQASSKDKEWTVGNMRRWIDSPSARGLPREMQDLLILVFAEQTDRLFYRNGAPVGEAETGRLEDDFELREQDLPVADTWSRAVEIANAVFGLGLGPGRSASNVAQLAMKVRDLARGSRDEAAKVCRILEDRTPASVKDTSARLATSRALAEWLDQLAACAEDRPLVSKLAAAPVAAPVTPAALGTAQGKLKVVLGALEGTNWKLLNGLGELNDERRTDAQKLLGELALALSQDEYARPIANDLRRIEEAATTLLVKSVSPPPPLPPTVPRGWKQIEHKKLGRLGGHEATRELDSLKKKLEQDRGLSVELDWRLYRKDGEA